MQPVVKHRYVRFRLVHHSIIKFHGVYWIVSLGYPRINDQVFTLSWFVRDVGGFNNERSEVGRADSICRTGRRQTEVIGYRGVISRPCSGQLCGNQEIVIAR